jgi:hypothetical protein
LSEDDVSFGALFESVDEIRLNSAGTRNKTTEFHEKQIAQQVYDLATVVSDVLSMIRGHLSCHDCRVVDHEHISGQPWAAGAVERVFDGVVERVDE